MYCSHCGGPVGRSAMSCPACGRSLGAKSSIPIVEEPPHQAATPRWRPADEPKAEPAVGLKGKLLWLLGGDLPAQPAAKASIPIPQPPEINERAHDVKQAKFAAPDKEQAMTPLEEMEPPSSGVVKANNASDLQATERITGDLTPVGGTAAGFGIDLGKLKIPKLRHILQVLDAGGKWCDWGTVSTQGLGVGRGKTSANIPALQSLGARHFRLFYEESSLIVEDLGSLNGVFRKIVGPTPLGEGDRIRVGNYVLEYRHGEKPTAVAPLRSNDGEEYCARDLAALAYLDLIRPDGGLGVRVPIIRPEGLILGRDPKESSLALPDPAVSTRHAEVKREAGSGSPFLLNDLGSRNGTYTKVAGRGVVEQGDVLLAGQVLFRISLPTA